MLSERQQAFVYEYLFDHNGTQAALRAGYSERGVRVQAHRLLRNANITQALEAEHEVLRAKCLVGLDDILEGLQDAFQDAKSRQNAREMIIACREMGKLLGLYDHLSV